MRSANLAVIITNNLETSGHAVSRPTICLNMIVKNESAILMRCLESVGPWVDRYVVLDTGSTDETKEIIRNFFDKRGIAGVIIEHPFEDFSSSRNRALEAWRTSAADNEYALLLDADMELVVQKEDWRHGLNAGAYLVRQRSGISYDNVRLVHSRTPATYIGSTHEYISTPHPSPLEGIFFLDHTDGASRPEKFERDERLLKGDIERDPKNARAWFYLAQTYKDWAKFNDAIVAYDKRIELGGWEEEVWFAQYSTAICAAALNDESAMLTRALKAVEMRPTRAEPLFTLAHYYRLKGKNHAASLFAARGAQIPYPEHDRLFIEDFVYHHGLKEELSIAGYYSPLLSDRDNARKACFELITSPETPCGTRSVAHSNSVFHANAIGLQTKIIPSLLSSKSDEPEIWRATNPSVANINGKVWAIVRHVNYAINEQGQYVISSVDGKVRTRNVLVLLTDERETVSKGEEIIDCSETPKLADWILGFEDLRLVWWMDRMWAFATTREHSTDSKAQVAFLELDQSRIVRVHLQDHIDATRHQKNWMPYVNDNGELYLVYECEPFTVLRMNPRTFQAERTATHETDLYLGHLRGGTQGIGVGQRVLFGVHEAIDQNGKRQYLHRFLLTDLQLKPVWLSDPFTFLGTGIEFAAGLALNERQSGLVISFGKNDQTAHIAEITFDQIMTVGGRVVHTTNSSLVSSS